jgi:nicotinamidase-related amidase
LRTWLNLHLARPVAIDTRKSQDGTVKKSLHRPRLSAIILRFRPPALIQIAAPFSSRLSRYTFRGRGLPVVLVNVAGRAPGRTKVQFNFTPPADWTELVPELDHQPSDYTVTKQQIGAFYGTALEQILRRHGVTQVVLAGVATSSGVEATARNAYDHGYNVTLVVDAMTDLSADAHRHSVETIFPRLGETATTDDVIRSLGERPH